MVPPDRDRRLAFDWTEDWSPTLHRPLLEKHGLVDVLTMASAVSALTRRASRLLSDSGDQVLADWVMYNSSSVQAILLPRNIAEPVWNVCRWKWDGDGPRQWLVMWDGIFWHLGDLEYLDLHKGLSPLLWVRREGLSLGAAARSAAQHQAARVFYGNMLWEDCAWNKANDASDSWEYGWMMGMEPSSNRWWHVETRAAAAKLSRLSGSALERAIERGVDLQQGGPDTRQYWTVVFRERTARVPYAVDAADEETRDPCVQARLPELGGIAFYHVDQLQSIYEGVMGGRPALNLLSDLSDADFKKGRVASMRSELGYPRTETRGRLPRDEQTVEKIGQLVEAGVPKYRISKMLGMPRSTVYDHWRAHVQSRDPKGTQK
jgi:hypothetical protein